MSNQFTLEDARNLIAIAQEAPIPGGARMAVARTELYQRFEQFFNDASHVPEPPKTRKQRERKGQDPQPSDTLMGDAEDLTK
jgi:hypothetical protein